MTAGSDLLWAKAAYVSVLNEEVLAGAAPLHREDVARLLLALPHQEVAVLRQQLLNLQPGNRSVVPALLFQRPRGLLHRGAAEERLMTRGRNTKQKKRRL